MHPKRTPPVGGLSGLRTDSARRTDSPAPRLSRRSFGLAAASTAALGLVGCGSSTSSDPTSVRIVDYYNTPADDVVIEKTFTECAKRLGLTYTREKVPGEQLIAKVLQMGSSKTLPDILMLDNPDLPQLAASGALAPLEQYGFSTKGFTPAIAELGRLDGTLYGIAPTVNTIALFYDVKMFEKAGIDPPTTWEETREAARALTGDGTYGIAFSAIASYEGTFQFMPFMWSNGGDEDDLAGEGVAGAAEFWSQLVRDGSASRSVVNWGQGDVIDQFKAGNAAMAVNGPWNIAGLEADTPDLEWDVVTLPVPRAGEESVAPLGGEVWTIPVTGDEEKQRSAAKLLEAFVSPANQLQMGTARSTIPGDARTARTFAKQNPDLATFVEQVSTARSRTGELGPEWPRTAKAIYTANQQVLVDDTDPRKAFDEAARTVS
ncbi:ABC transporter substrate-binding protein [Brachybacterium endophyticum]|uniref:ABC transporter substrate-binding protein n=1 Tax=Brachybacterium endophyticum TaxID=2182385 RepID=A0A2U2RMV2_9MICO|nr:extracellular solute-binding protein [Brachybacterium endophyticum]PWH07176.1 ABC transporter substrate-binding protein [Brachybacterium endophyticum]